MSKELAYMEKVAWLRGYIAAQEGKLASEHLSAIGFTADDWAKIEEEGELWDLMSFELFEGIHQYITQK